MRFTDIKWAPLNIPLHRRLETASAAFFIGLVLFSELSSIIILYKLIFSNYCYIGLAYLIWLIYDMNKCERGGRRFEWARSLSFWFYLRDYFPAKLVKTTNLDPNKNYLLACFPHGLVCTGPTLSFLTNTLKFKEIFPGMSSYLIMLRVHFLIPFMRDFFLSLGACASTKESLYYLLDDCNGTGNCVSLLIGGASEALHTQPGTYKIILKKRKGFIRVALKTGASLVPVVTFGENDILRPLESPEGSLSRAFQDGFKKLTGVIPIIPSGRGIFQYSFGPVPHRKPITTVVGSPIEVKKSLEPTTEEVETLHKIFTEKLIQLFESEKSKYLKNYNNTYLVIV